MISDVTSTPAILIDDEVDSAEETGSEVESESEGHESNPVDDDDDSKPKRAHIDEQKMVVVMYIIACTVNT